MVDYICHGINVNYNLLLAVREGKLERTRELIDTFGLSCSQEWSDGYIFLCEALKNKHVSIAKLLLGCGCKVNSENSFNPTLDTPLHYAVICGDIEIVKMVLNSGAWIDAETKSGEHPLLNGKTPLQLAVEKGNLATVEYILKYCPDINNKSNRYSLEIAVYGYGETYEQVVEALLGYGLTVNPPVSNNLLETVIRKGYIEIVQDLLKRGVDVNTLVGGTDAFMKSSPLLNFAVNYNQEGIAGLLISYKADINAQDAIGRTPLCIAAINDYKKILELLLENGAKVDFRNKYGQTALHYACNEGCIEAIAVLLEFGSDINITCLNSFTPLGVALCGFFELDEVGITDNRVVAEYLVCHIAKMKVANLYVSERNFLLVNEAKKYRLCGGDFVDQCVKELERMKNEKICDCTFSFYDILTKGEKSLAVYMRNENIVKALKSTSYTIEFPLYAIIIKSRFRKGMERKELLELGHRSFNSFLNNLTYLPYGCTEKILSYLSNKDLENLKDVFKSHCYN